AKDARRGIGRAARRKRNDHGDRSGRPALRRRLSGRGGDGKCAEHQQRKSKPISHVLLPKQRVEVNSERGREFAADIPRTLGCAVVRLIACRSLVLPSSGGNGEPSPCCFRLADGAIEQGFFAAPPREPVLQSSRPPEIPELSVQ